MLSFDIYRPAFCYHYDVKIADSQENAYFCKATRLTRSSVPDLVLYTGSSATGTAVAMSHILQFSQTCKLGLGMHDTQWEDFTQSNKRGSEHSWAMSLNDVFESSSTARRLRLIWKRTTSVTTEGSAKPVIGQRGYRGFRGWKLVDADDQKNILAVFTFDKAFGRRGTVDINVDYGKGFVRGVLMSILTLYERSER